VANLSDEAFGARLTSRSVLVRNTVLTLVGQALPLLVGIVVTPFIIRGLGDAGFGLLSLGWTILTLALVFNLGLGRATTRYASEQLATGDVHSLPSLFWTSVVLNVVFGLLGGVLVAAIPLWLVAHGVLKTPVSLQPAARALFIWVAISVPFTFVTTTLRGMLEAGQHFAETTLGRVIFTTSLFVLPAAGLALGGLLPAIGCLLAASRIAETLFYAALCVRRYPVLRSWSLTTDHLRPLLVYGGWLTVTNLLLPLFLSQDRFVIGSLLSVSAVAFYAVPADVVTRLLIVPVSVVTPLFPAFAVLVARGDLAGAKRLHAHGLKYMLLGMAAVLAPVVVFARPFLHAWVGEAYAAQGTLVLQILAAGVFLNAVACLPYTVLQAVGRADVTAKCHLIETPIAVAAMVVLTARYGIVGAAVAWSLRVGLDLVLLVVASVRLRYLGRDGWLRARCGRATALAGLLLVVACAVTRVDSIPAQVALAAGLGLVWGAVAWRIAFNPTEYRALVAGVRSLGPTRFVGEDVGVGG
jgi:O-antigen/teichoic acid export membrane protein